MQRIKLMSDAGRGTGRAERCPARRPVGPRPLPQSDDSWYLDYRRPPTPGPAAELLAEVRRWLDEERIAQTIVWIGEQPFAVSG